MGDKELTMKEGDAARASLLRMAADALHYLREKDDWMQDDNAMRNTETFLHYIADKIDGFENESEERMPTFLVENDGVNPPTITELD